MSPYDQPWGRYDGRSSRGNSDFAPRPYSPRRDHRDSPGTYYSRSRPHDSSRTPPRGPAADRRSYGDYMSNYRSSYSNRSHRSSPPSPRWRDRSRYRDRDRVYDDPRSRSRDWHSRSDSRSRSRSRSPSRGRRRGYGHESREIMLEGVPVDMNEDDVRNELTQFYHVETLEDVRVIRDRQTKISRQLTFLRFPSLDDSRDFMEKNFPSIYLYGNGVQAEDGAKVRIAFSREREDRNRIKAEGEWFCQNCAVVNYATRNRCFRCHATRSEILQHDIPRAANNGDNDVGPANTPSQFILLRGLEHSVSEEVLAKGVFKLYKPTAGNDQQGVKKGAKVASTTGDANLGAREDSIRRVLLVRDRRSNDSWRFGFAEFATVEDAQAALTRYNSFESFTISSRPVLASYIHAGVFVPVINPSPSIERFTFSPLGNQSMKLAYWDENAYVTELMISSPPPEIPKNIEKKPTKDVEKQKKRKAETKEAAASRKMAVPSHLRFWSDRHAELHGIQRDQDKAENSEGNAEETAPPTRSYADLNRNCCYLCMRQFQRSADVNRHERLSDLHRNNLKDEAAVSRALFKLEKHKNDPPPSTEYRDRAKERRQIFGSSRQPKDKKPKPNDPKKEEPVPTISKGASLLGKMGWSAGTGLGAQGSGMTAPLTTDAYVQGVGLGAEGGKIGDAAVEAARNTRGRYDEFLARTKEGARERYDKLNKE